MQVEIPDKLAERLEPICEAMNIGMDALVVHYVRWNVDPEYKEETLEMIGKRQEAGS